MPKVKFLASVPGDATNRLGWHAGDTVWVSADEAARRLAAGEVEVLESDPAPAKDAKSAPKSAATKEK